MRATIGGISFDEWPRNFDTSFVITPGGLKGWMSGTTIRRDEVARPSAHGAFDAPGFQSARVVSIEGAILATSEDVLERMILQLTGLLADGSTGQLTVQDDHGNATWADVRLAAQTQVDRSTTGREADFQVQFWAPDPRRYGDLQSFPPAGASAATGSVSVFHRGNFPAHPVISIGSAPSAYEITSPAGTFSVAGAAAGGTHVVDMRTGRVTRNGVLMPGVSSGATWAVPPGDRWSHSLSVPSGFRVQLHDTYV